MNYKELIEHVIGNALVYMESFKSKELDDQDIGLLRGFWMDIDSINNQLIIEGINGRQKEASQLQKELQLEKILDDLKKMIGD